MAFVAAGMSAAAWRLVVYNQEKVQRQEAAWRAVANKLRGEFVPASGWLPRTPMSISAIAGGSRVFVDQYTVSRGRSSTTYTRVQASGEGPRDLRLTVREKDVFSSIGKVLGAQDVVVGDAPFDERFVVKASDEDLARAWLVPDVTRAWFEALPYACEVGPNGKVVATRLGVESDADALLRAVKASVSIAGRGAAIRAEWGRLAHELRGVVGATPWIDREPRLEIQEQGTAVIVELARSEWKPKALRGRLLTTVRARRPAPGGEHFAAAAKGALNERDGEVVEFEQGNEAGLEVRSTLVHATAARFDAELLGAIAEARPLRLWGDDDILVVGFPGLMLDVARLRRAVEIVVRLAATVGTGPYR